MDVRTTSRSMRLSRFTLVVMLVASLALLGACSSGSKKGSTTAAKNKHARTTLAPGVRWRQCLARHGVHVKPPTKKAKFTRQQLAAALKKSKKLRVRFTAALLKPPNGAQVTAYRRAANACLKPGAL